MKNLLENMSILPAYWRDIHPARRWTLIWPRQHGAWGILLVSLITGASVGFSPSTNLFTLLWLTVAVVAAFCLRTPVENSLPASPCRPRGSVEWRWVVIAASIYALTGALAIAMLISAGFSSLLWKLGLAAAGFFALQAVAKRLGRSGRLPGEIMGTFGLTLAAVAGWAVAADGFEQQALAIWILNGLFAADQILFVQLKIREVRASKGSSGSSGRRLFLAVEALIALLLIGGAHAGFIPWLGTSCLSASPRAGRSVDAEDGPRSPADSSAREERIILFHPVWTPAHRRFSFLNSLIWAFLRDLRVNPNLFYRLKGKGSR